MISKLSRFAAIALLICATAAVHRSIPPTTLAQRGEAFVPRPRLVKAVSLGFEAVLADFYWLWAVQVVGAQSADPAASAVHLGRLIDVVTTLDPWVDHPYRFAAVWLIDSEESVRTANRLLRRGIAHHPEEWRNRYHLGFNHFFYLQENEMAAEVLESAMFLPGAPLYLRRLVARLRAEGADIEAAAVFLQGLLEQAPDSASRMTYRSALDEIEIEHDARRLDDARRIYLERNGQDITRVADLTSGPRPILQVLPDPEPSSVPAQLSKGSRWILDFESDRILSTYYGRRYELSFQAVDRQRRQEWRREQHEREGGNEVEHHGV